MPKHETRNILLNNLGSKQSVNEIWPDYVTIQKKNLSINSVRIVA